ncbi:response regulator [Phragmitibacter flavus]|uniref:Response regulator n=1 Tax=Phragmitibacter flavus TaxID=2576071 RepID=A0A5R8KEQ0_9BACT|nr:response regulator [Phragmitibacter flavus]TLD70770.1 response regulator [Phragmitibacter flavus]
MKILAVEDDPVSLMVLEASLVSLGHEVLTAINGHEAWEVLCRQSIRVVISDWEMPRVNGLELCSLIRNRQRQGAAPVHFVLLTKSTASEMNREKAREAGVDDFLEKPFLQADLVRCLANLGEAASGSWSVT